MTKCLLCGRPFNVTLSLAFLMNFKPYRQSLICSVCWHHFKRIDQNHCCKDCGRSGSFKNLLCRDCLRWRRTGKRFVNRSMYQYNSMMSEYMHRYKFQGDYQLRQIFQRQFSKFVIATHRVIVPVPIHLNTYQQRGFNQVVGLLGSTDMVMALKTRQGHKAIPQSHKSRTDRLRLKQPFILFRDRADKVKGRDVVVVDDVYTTGTTLHHAARVLAQAGAKSVTGITLAH